MTTTAPVPTIPIDRSAEPHMRLVPVPTGRVSLVDRTLMRLGLALLLASTQHATRTEQHPEPRRIDLDHRPVGVARQFC
jgi:hypothetical protein